MELYLVAGNCETKQSQGCLVQSASSKALCDSLPKMEGRDGYHEIQFQVLVRLVGLRGPESELCRGRARVKKDASVERVERFCKTVALHSYQRYLASNVEEHARAGSLSRMEALLASGRVVVKEHH